MENYGISPNVFFFACFCNDICLSLPGSTAIRCFQCGQIRSIPDGIEAGPLACSDPGWNLTEADTDYIREDRCLACVKMHTYLGRE